MESLEEFRSLVESEEWEKAFDAYKLDFNPSVFDTRETGYKVKIDWEYSGPNIIRMIKSDSGREIYYLPWQPKKVTSVTLDGSCPAYFVTSHFSNCRFTMKYHDSHGKKVTVLHVAGDVSKESSWGGSEQRDDLEKTLKVEDKVVRERRLSIAGQKKIGKQSKAKMEKAMKAGKTYYDTYARVFGYRNESGGWEFVAQNINEDHVSIGAFNIGNKIDSQ